MSSIDPRAEEHETPEHFVVTLPAVEASVPQARRAVLAACRKLGADEALCAKVALAASEAVTNAVLHAFSPGGAGEMTAALRRDGDELELVVSDNGRGLVPRTDSPGMGMGLGIIAEVCDRLSIAADGRRGTELHMWFRLPG
jgi:anti-sigma regulatory factor (Ser/Thr protein kinase)